MPSGIQAEGSGERPCEIRLPVSVRDFANITGLKPFRVIDDLMGMDIFSALDEQMTEQAVLSVSKKNGLWVRIIRRKGDAEDSQN